MAMKIRDTNTPRSIRFTENEEAYFIRLQELVMEKVGAEVDTTWIIKRLIHHGGHPFRREFGIKQIELYED